jgi:hypothetical protein
MTLINLCTGYSASERTFVLDIGNMRVVDDIKYHCVCK